MDLMWLDKRPLRHIVDTENGFKDAIFVEEKSSESLWSDFMICWNSFYTCFPDRIRIVVYSCFTSIMIGIKAEDFENFNTAVLKNKIPSTKVSDITTHYGGFSTSYAHLMNS